jgi:heme exporter protein CcmD
MNHAPFIWAAYAIGTVVLLWCALAPLAHKRTISRDIRKLIQLEEVDRDSHA